MQPPLFYAPPECRDGDIIVLPPEEARHAARVLRLRRGAIVIAVDGLGNACRAELVSVAARKMTARVHSEIRDFGEPSVRLTLAAGLSTGAKFDSVIQRGTELGVGRFVPLVTDKSKVAVDEPRRVRGKVTRWRNVATAAMKQCRRSCIPEIATPTAFADFLGQFEPDDLGIIFHPADGTLSLDKVELARDSRRITLAVGPEAGFTDDEVARAKQSGFVCVGLGRRILRTETAGPVAVALVMARLGELR